MSTFKQLEEIVKNDVAHGHYSTAKQRAMIMKSWFNGEDLTNDSKYNIIQRSKIESSDEFNEKVDRMKLLPLEQKFFSSQQRIYDEENVQRIVPDTPSSFWQKKLRRFDDKGDAVDVFFKDKVLFIKEVLGFGGSVIDLVTQDGRTLRDEDGNVIPYCYPLRPDELLNFRVSQGILEFLVSKQHKTDVMGNKIVEYRGFLPDSVFIWRKTEDDEKKLISSIDNPFDRIPVILLKGAVDERSHFNIGRPRRFHIKGLYMAASELFYDLQKGSLLYAHPTPVMYESLALMMAGVEREGRQLQDFDSTTLKERLGFVTIVPDGSEMPRELFHQADTQGLDHLRKVIFQDLMALIFFLANIRDKKTDVANISGRAKQFDNLDEQSLLAQTALDMETIEREHFDLMGGVREEPSDKFTITYSKHHDLSTADELFSNMEEAARAGIRHHSLWAYWLPQYLRKRSAPKDVQEAAATEISTIGNPPEKWEYEAIKDIIGDVQAAIKVRPELVGDNQTLLDNLNSIEQALDTNP